MSDTSPRPDEHRDGDADGAGSTPRSLSARLRTLPETFFQSAGPRRFLRRFGLVGALAITGLAVATGAALPDSGWLGGTGGGAEGTAANTDRQVDERAGRAGADRSAPASKPATPSKPRDWVYPMANYRVTSCFGQRWGRSHQGIDIAWHHGEPILAAHKGTVIRAGDAGDGYGRKVVISHGNNTFTLYGHGSKVLVRPGQQVAAGQRIALEGTTGHSTGPHLHFEVHHGYGHRIDPAPYMRDRGVDFGGKC